MTLFLPAARSVIKGPYAKYIHQWGSCLKVLDFIPPTTVPPLAHSTAHPNPMNQTISLSQLNRHPRRPQIHDFINYQDMGANSASFFVFIRFIEKI